MRAIVAELVADDVEGEAGQSSCTRAGTDRSYSSSSSSSMPSTPGRHTCARWTVPSSILSGSGAEGCRVSAASGGTVGADDGGRASPKGKTGAGRPRAARTAQEGHHKYSSSDSVESED